MKLTQIDITNFRLLRKTSIRANGVSGTTILVGPNKSGKTSVAEAMLLFAAGGKKGFSAFDFSMSCREKFSAAEKLILEEKDDAVATGDLPSMSVDLHFEYNDDGPDLAVAADLLMDIDVTSNKVRLRIEFGALEGPTLARNFRELRRPGDSLFNFLLLNLPTSYGLSYYKVSPSGDEVQKLDDGKIVDRLLKVDFVFAQRHIDDQENSRATRLSHLLYTQYERHHKAAEPASHEDIERTLAEHAKDLGAKYMRAFSGLIESLKRFGYPQKRAPAMSIRAELNASTLFKENTRIYYGPFQAQPSPQGGQATPPSAIPPADEVKVAAAIAGAVAAADSAEKSGVSVVDATIEQQISLELPEKYNGLGFKNLIYMILQIQSFRIELERITEDRPRVHVVFIEEPETHLHPQVQSVFIREISSYLAGGNDVPDAQALITTHASHIIADSGFNPIRYFKRIGNEVTVKDLLSFEDSIKTTPASASPESNTIDAVRFLGKYMSLTRCDLFFADKAILVEGQVERLLLPTMIAACAAAGRPDFGSSYITIMEVGGAYAHMFEALLKFIEIPTLIITDLDAVGADGKKCPVIHGVSTSNATLKGWLPKKAAIAELHAATAQDKQDATIRVAYQCPEVDGGSCGRSFEEAFIYANAEWLLANKSLLGITGPKFNYATPADLQSAAYGLELPKVDFALDLLLQTGWQSPRYIRDGIEWLADYEVSF
jgi:putative ATP-dependent endonuclease of OLD family